MNEIDCYFKVYGDLVFIVPHYSLFYLPGVNRWHRMRKLDTSPGAVNSAEVLNERIRFEEQNSCTHQYCWECKKDTKHILAEGTDLNTDRNFKGLVCAECLTLTAEVPNE